MMMTTEPPRPPDRPPVKRPRFTRGAGVIAAIGTLVVGAYTAIAFTGFELASPTRDELPSSVRSSPGGVRSPAFWHSGYHGGK